MTMNEKIQVEREKMKYEVAKELGLTDKISAHGWEGLSNAECGRIGGIMSRRIRGLKQEGEGKLG